MKKYIVAFLILTLLPYFLSSQIKVHVKTTGESMEFHEITKEEIQRDFKKTGKTDIHPRLFFSNKEIENIKELLKQGDPFVVMYYENAKKEADKILTTPLLHYELDAANLRIPSIHAFAGQIPPLIFMYLMTGEEKYAERCWKQIEVMAEYPDWGADRHFLDTGIGGFNVAFIYDALYYYLTPQQRKVIEDTALKHVITPGKTQIETQTGVWKWYLADNNWNGICNGGIVMASLAMYESNPDYLSESVRSAANGLPHYISEFEPDGQSEEGLMYWGYGLMYTDLCFEAMSRILGTDYEYSRTPGLKKAGWFPVLMSGPVSSINIGDDPLRTSRDIGFFWFAKHFDDAALARQQYDLCMENKKSNWQDIYFYDPNMLNTTVYKEPSLDNYLRGIELMSLRENWTSKDAMYISMHGGANNANHGHLDAGSFYIQAFGEVFAYGNLGRDDYTFPGFFSKNTYPEYTDELTAQKESGRWHFYRLRTEGKNCITINPSIRPEQNEQAKAIVIDEKSTSDFGSYTLDLTECYQRDVSFYNRTISLDREEKYMSVKDELTCKEPDSEIWWFMHTKADIKLSSDKKNAILTVNGKQLNALIQSPLSAEFEILPATYLLEGQYPYTKNSSNDEFKRLAIKLESTDKTTIEIRFK